MPHKKKKAFSNAKKKRGSRSSNNNRGTQSTRRGNEDPFRNLGNLPALPGAHRGEGNDSGGSGDYYGTYKRATTRFWEWMKEMAPVMGLERMQSVNDLHKGADAVLSRNVSLLTSPPPPDPIIAPPEIMMALETGIQYREKFTSNTFGSAEGGDAGHQYMTGVLRHCHAALTLSRKVARVVLEVLATEAPDDDETREEVDRIGGRFYAFLASAEEEEAGDDEEREQIRRGDVPTVDVALPPAPEEEIDIEQDLIQGDDRFQAVALLHTMDELMGTVDSHYVMLKNYLRGQELFTYASPVQFMLECAATANLAIESVQAAEAALIARHPHLSSFYHVLALVFLPSMVAGVDQLMGQQKRNQEAFHHHFALDFTASIVECSFHNRGDERVAGRVKRHVKKMGVPLAALERKAKEIHAVVQYETLLEMEERMNYTAFQTVRANGVEPHSWLHISNFIGNDRCILNTQKIVQMVLDVLQDRQKLVGRPGFWGQEFDEFNRPAESFRGGLDEVFGGRIMPELLEICRQAPWEMLPEVSRLMPVIGLLHAHLHQGDRTRPVPISLTFGLHAVLTSIFALQGAGDLTRVANLGKRSFGTLFGQLDTIADPSRLPENAPIFYQNVGLFKNVANFAKPVPSTIDSTQAMLDPEQTEKLAFWNPVVGGGYLLYGTYICSVGLGSATVDSLGQLRFTLHMYNALKQCNSTVEVPFLEQLQAVFSQTKAIWVGGRPDRGSLCKHFWMAWGMSIAHAAQMAEEGPVGNDGLAAHLGKQNTRRSELTRTLEEINPSEFSASYKRVVEHNFADDKDGAAEYTSGGTTKEARKQYGSLIDHLTLVNMTRDSMDDDEGFVLHTNFSVVGCMLLEYTNSLSEHMGWNAIMDQFLLQFPEVLRTGKTMGGREMRPGSFHTSDLNLKRQGQAHLWGNFLAHIDASTDASLAVDRAAKFTADFFKDRDKTEYTFFAPDGESQAIGRNPLEGDFAIGRTGRSMQDPLKAFMHFKYSKRGEPVVRMIKPGKYTPYHPTREGDVATPYSESGSKATAGTNGKIRHIASYSLDELIALGWDGAMYHSSKGRHAANGTWVPFVCGYDSDSADEYEAVDLQLGRQNGTVGLPRDEVGRYMEVPNMTGGRDIAKLNK